MGRSKAKKVIILDDVASLESYSISSENLTEIAIPSSVTTIKSGAFVSSNNIKKIIIYGKNIEFDSNDNLFYKDEDSIGTLDVSDKTIVCYKDSSVETYAKSKGYKVEYIEEKDNNIYGLLSNTGNQTVGYNTNLYSIRIDANYDEFLLSGVVFIDGNIVNPNYYKTKNGSTIINFTNEFLKTLSVGNHVIKVSFANGSATTNVTVKESVDKQPEYDYDTSTDSNKEETKNPPTNDKKSIVGYLICGLMFIMIVCKKRLNKLTNK